MGRTTTGKSTSLMSVSEAVALIDKLAERQRLRYLTGGEGKGMIYLQKRDEANAASLVGAPSPEDFPMLASTLGVDGESIAEVAATVKAKADVWLVIGAHIEKTSSVAQKAIEDGGDIPSILAGLNWNIS